MTPDLILFLSIIALFFVVGLPLITKKVWLPVELEIEDVPEQQLTDRQRIFFDDLDAELGALYFRPACTYSVTNLQGPNLVRTYLSEADPCMVHAMALRSEEEPTAESVAMTYFEIATRFSDGTSISTRNGDASSVFSEPPHNTVIVRRTLTDATSLKKDHDRRIAKEQLRGPVYTTADRLFDAIREHHQRWCAFQVSTHALHHDVEANLYRPTVRTGLRGIFNFLNPLADNFTLRRFLIGLVAGVAIPVLGILYLGDPSSPFIGWAEAETGLPVPVLRWSAMTLVFSVLGLVSGSVFSSKSFLWTFLLAWFPLRLIGPSIWPALGLSLWAGTVASMVSSWKMKRQSLV